MGKVGPAKVEKAPHAMALVSWNPTITLNVKQNSFYRLRKFIFVMFL